MELLTKWIHNKKFMLTLAAGLAGVLVLLVLIIILMPRPAQQEDPRQATQETTLPPTIQAIRPKENSIAPDSFVMDGAYLSCTDMPCELGVDVCSYQGKIDWQQVADAGVKFAMIRVGGRGWGPEGRLYTDEYARINYQGAKAAGIKVGVYFFSQAINVREAREEAQYVLRLIDGWELEMPVVFDWEQIPTWTDPDSRTADIHPRTVTDCTVVFCDAMEEAGFVPMLYTNIHQYENLLFAEEVKHYAVWTAEYSQQLTFPYYMEMWQYTASGSVPGIEGEVDLNLYFPETMVS